MNPFKFKAIAAVLCLLLLFMQTAAAGCACDEMPAKKQNMAKHCSEHGAAGDEAEKPIQAQHTMDGGATCSMMAGCHITALPALSFELQSSDFVVSQGVPIRLTLYCFDFPPPVKPPNVLLG